MRYPTGHEIHSFADSLRAPTGKMPPPMFRWRSCANVFLLALLMAGCNHSIANYPIASEENVDVCALALDAVTATINEAQVTRPSQNVCLFSTAETSDVRGSIQIVLYTRASMGYSEGLGQVLRNTMAEAEQTYGNPGFNGFGDLPEGAVAVAFGMNPPEFIDEVIVTERGVLMAISISGEVIGHDQLVALTRELWMRVTTYDPTKGTSEENELS